jgi:hypothetical protein
VFWVIIGCIVGSLGISQVREGLPVVWFSISILFEGLVILFLSITNSSVGFFLPWLSSLILVVAEVVLHCEVGILKVCSGVLQLSRCKFKTILSCGFSLNGHVVCQIH